MASKVTSKPYLTDGSIKRRTVSVHVFIKGRKRAQCHQCDRPAQYFARWQDSTAFGCGLHIMVIVRLMARYRENWNRRRATA